MENRPEAAGRGFAAGTLRMWYATKIHAVVLASLVWSFVDLSESVVYLAGEGKLTDSPLLFSEQGSTKIHHRFR